MSNKAWDRRVARRRRKAVVAILKAHVGNRTILVGDGRVLEAVQHEVNRAMARHLALWIEDIIPPEGATIAELRELTGAGKKSLRSKLAQLETAGRVEMEKQTRKWFLSGDAPAD